MNFRDSERRLDRLEGSMPPPRVDPSERRYDPRRLSLDERRRCIELYERPRTADEDTELNELLAKARIPFFDAETSTWPVTREIDLAIRFLTSDELLELATLADTDNLTSEQTDRFVSILETAEARSWLPENKPARLRAEAEIAAAKCQRK